MGDLTIDFPLVLVALVFGSGLLWLIDALLLAPGRRREVSRLRVEYPRWDTPGSADAARYEARVVESAREPVVVEYARSFFPVLLVVFVLRSFLVEPFQIPSSSMEPTLQVGDYILVNKYTYGIRLPVLRTKVLSLNEPERGDVMVFFPPHMPDTYFIKRVIGLPGDRVSYVNHVLTINGDRVPEERVALVPEENPEYRLVKETLGNREYTVRKHLEPGRYSRQGSWTVPEGHYFMMGDNRDGSFDSRGWNDLNRDGGPSLSFVPENAVVGEAMAIWMHWDSLFSLPRFDDVGKIE